MLRRCEALSCNLAIEGATNPKIINGTKKKINWPQICRIDNKTPTKDLGIRKPIQIPTITPKSSLKSVFENKFFIPIYFYIINYLSLHSRAYLTHCCRAVSTSVIPDIPNLSTNTDTTFGDKKVGNVGPKWIFLTPNDNKANSTITPFAHTKLYYIQSAAH